MMTTLAYQLMSVVHTESAKAGGIFSGVRLGGRCRVDRMMLLLRYNVAVRW